MANRSGLKFGGPWRYRPQDVGVGYSKPEGEYQGPSPDVETQAMVAKAIAGVDDEVDRRRELERSKSFMAYRPRRT
jgi:hypothetical protein